MTYLPNKVQDLFLKLTLDWVLIVVGSIYFYLSTFSIFHLICTVLTTCYFDQWQFYSAYLYWNIPEIIKHNGRHRFSVLWDLVLPTISIGNACTKSEPLQWFLTFWFSPWSCSYSYLLNDLAFLTVLYLLLPRVYQLGNFFMTICIPNMHKLVWTIEHTWAMYLELKFFENMMLIFFLLCWGQRSFKNNYYASIVYEV